MSYKIIVANQISAIVRATLRACGNPLYRHVHRAMSVDLDAREVQASGGRMEINLHCPEYRDPDPADTALVERLYIAFERMCEAQDRANPLYQPSRMWRGKLDEAYQPLVEALTEGNRKGFHWFLENFGAWERDTGIESTVIVRRLLADPTQGRAYEQRVLAPMVRWWLNAESRGRGLEALSYPRHGNQAGALIDGSFMGLGSVGNDFYAEMMRRELPAERPIIAEIGGGYGKFLYFIARDLHDFCYLDFDLPEVAICAAYWLMKAFPGRRTLLYGEGPLDADAIAANSLIFWPGFGIEQLPDNSVDLMLNKNTLGEVTRSACDHFVNEICRTSEAFFHMNHEFFRNEFDAGERSVINAEYAIDSGRFTQVIRMPEILQMNGAGSFNPDADIYCYLYRRCAVAACSENGRG